MQRNNHFKALTAIIILFWGCNPSNQEKALKEELRQLKMDYGFLELQLNLQREEHVEDSLNLEVCRDQVSELWRKLEKR